MAALVARGDKVAIVQPDYFANRKMVEFLEAELVPEAMAYAAAAPGAAGIELAQLEDAFRASARTFLFSNPNKLAGVVYSRAEIGRIAALAAQYGATVIVDQLYSRLLYHGCAYAHLRAVTPDADNVVTILGPSKTESLSSYRLGVAFGTAPVTARKEKLQVIVFQRSSGYSQAVLRGWFAEPAGWMADRIAQHQAIRDDLVARFRTIDGCTVRSPDASSYFFPRLPALSIPPAQFVKALRLQAGVTVTPGAEFSPHAAHSVRLNFSTDHGAAVVVVDRLAVLVDRYRT